MSIIKITKDNDNCGSKSVGEIFKVSNGPCINRFDQLGIALLSGITRLLAKATAIGKAWCVSQPWFLHLSSVYNLSKKTHLKAKHDKTLGNAKSCYFTNVAKPQVLHSHDPLWLAQQGRFLLFIGACSNDLVTRSGMLSVAGRRAMRPNTFYDICEYYSFALVHSPVNINFHMINSANVSPARPSCPYSIHINPQSSSYCTTKFQAYSDIFKIFPNICLSFFFHVFPRFFSISFWH